MIRRVLDFVDDRTGVRGLVRHLLDEPIRGGARWAYVFGSILLSTFAVQLVTGVALMASYAPSDKTAWASVHFIQYKQAGGWLVRGIHHFGAQAMVLGLGAHLVQVSLYRAYRKPREVTWWLGLVLLTLVLGFALTGYLLPWDQKGYWATRVATNIAGTVPGVGGATQRLLQGGPEYGSLTLTRFYTLHVFVLPALLVTVVLAHLALFRRHGVTPSARADVTKSETFFPKQVALDTAAALVVLVLVFAFAWREHGAPLDAPADPSSDYPARPEWYFLGLFQLLKYFHGPLEVVGTVLLPLAVGLYFFALPLLDKKPGSVRPLVPLALVALGAVALTLLAFRADAGDETFQKERARADVRARAAASIAMRGVPPEGPLAMLRSAPEVRGPELFDRHCASCHVLGTQGNEKDRTAPKLDGWATQAWIEQMLRDPDHDTRFGRTSFKGEMPAMEKMTDADVRATAAFLAGKPDPSGKEIVKTRCTSCHLFEGEGDDGGEGIAPELSGYGDLPWIRAQIANPSSKATYREKAFERKGHMPRFDHDLAAGDIDVLARWLKAETAR